MSTASDPGSTASDTSRLTAALYDELQSIAHRLLRSERPDHTLETSGLIHEAFLRLAAQHAAEWKNREHFLGAAATTMRRVLVDHARRYRAAKRRRDRSTTLVSVPAGITGGGENALDVLVLDEAISRLGERDERQARVVELRVFGGFEIDEVAAIVGVSERTVKRDWRFAKAWLACELSPAG